MRRALLTMVVLTLLLAGCGGDSDDAEPAGATTTTTVGTATPGSIDTNFTGEGSERFCGLARSYRDRLDKVATSDPTQLRALANEAETAIREAQAAAPNEIKGDVQVVAAASTAFFQQLARVNYDLTKMPPDAVSGLQRPEVQASTQRLSAYAEKVCGLSTTTVP
ncbi:MAG: hypothetical protein M3O23_04260 [Actinomycetota bacterium]|nr:hypothetical protein [Actinomycetota bacterium]